ncbi:MAG: hypothetical protein QOI73_593 [Solirubrobacteraceae bacterium]|nr:hypothetical protein [Solirubrobacteraceae bacterium]
MLIVALAILLIPLAWLAIKRAQHADPAAAGRLRRMVFACLAAALALRVVMVAPIPMRIALCALAIGALAIWLRRRGHGGDGPDDGRDPPVDPGPDPRLDQRAEPRPGSLDEDAFDRARGDWEHELKRPAPD